MNGASLILSIVSVGVVLILGLGGIIAQIWLAKEENERRIEEENIKQQQILHSIQILIINVQRAMNGHLEILNRDPPEIPSYFIPEINTFFYFSRLNSKIKGEDTLLLKQSLIDVENKIKNINRLIELGQISSVFGQRAKVGQLVTELKIKGYYLDLDKFLTILNNQWFALRGYEER